MEEKRFDELTREFARPISRRKILKVAVATMVGGILGQRLGGTAQADGPCPFDQCNNAVLINGQCALLPVADGLPCNDGNACTVNDTCQAGVCVGGNPVVCPTPDVCHTPGTCDSYTGVCSAPPLSVGSCKTGVVKGGPCECDGMCCTVGNVCVGKAGTRVCQPQD